MDPYRNALNDILSESGFTGFSINIAEKNDSSNHQVVCSIGLTGDVKGYLMIRSDLESARSFAALLAANIGMSPDDGVGAAFGSFHKEIISEVTNQVAGRAIMILSDTGRDCNITPPTLIVGNDIFTDMVNFDQFFTYHVLGTFGKITLFVGIKTTKI